jgi:hypothetical protein
MTAPDTGRRDRGVPDAEAPQQASKRLRGADAETYSHWRVVTMPHLDVESDMTNTIRPETPLSEDSP